MTANATSPEGLWEGFLKDAAAKLSRHVFETWLRPIVCRSFVDGVAILEIRDQFTRDWLHDHYVSFIKEGLGRQAGSDVAIEWVINPELRSRPPVVLAEESDEDLAAEEQGHADGHSGSRAYDHGPRGWHDGPAAHPLFNARYNFDAFICGPSNQFALAAARAVAEKPGQAYNPLFLFGRVGLGKTHLLSAIGNHVLMQRPARVIYTSAEQFTNEVVNAVLGNKLSALHTKYRNECELLLIDDIQLIAGKERTQHEFFHIFNTLYESQRQIVVTSDKLPHEIPDIEERLRNRFQWGLIADIQAPEIETRVAILRKKAQDDGVGLPDDVAFFLAESIRSNVRELEGALVRVMAHAALTGQALTVDYARTVLGDILRAKVQLLSVEAIQRLVAEYFNVRVAELKSHRRLKTLVRPRQVAMYLARKHAGASYPDLGSRFGDKDHTTVLAACRKVDKLLKTDTTLRSQVSELERQLDVIAK